MSDYELWTLILAIIGIVVAIIVGFPSLSDYLAKKKEKRKKKRNVAWRFLTFRPMLLANDSKVLSYNLFCTSSVNIVALASTKINVNTSYSDDRHGYRIQSLHAKGSKHVWHIEETPITVCDACRIRITIIKKTKIPAFILIFAQKKGSGIFFTTF